MCSKEVLSIVGSECLLLLLAGFVFTSGLCQNAEPEQTSDSWHLDAESTAKPWDTERAATPGQRFNWDAPPKGENPLDERTGVGGGPSVGAEAEPEVAPGGYRNKETALFPAATSGTPLAGRRDISIASCLTIVGSASDNGAARKKRRRNKGSKRTGARATPGENTRANETVAIANDRMTKTDAERRDRSEKWSRTRDNLVGSKRGKDRRSGLLRECRRKFRVERRRRKNREKRRKRNRMKRVRQERNYNRTKSIDGRADDAPAALLLGKLEIRASNESESKGDIPGEATPPYRDNDVGSEESRSNFIERRFSERLEKRIAENVRAEKPDDKQLRSRQRDGPESSRFDAEKMLGYSGRTKNDLPPLDAENDVLARSLMNYNAYVTSSLRREKADEHPIRAFQTTLKSLHHDGMSDEADLAADVSRGHPSDDPFRFPPPRDMPVPGTTVDHITDGTEKSLEDDSTTTAVDADDEKPTGDLSCINGTFLPAPLARHALIKYVKSSVPGHEYLEADYECTPGFHMASDSKRLLCKNRQWVGRVPRCKVRRGGDDVCAESSCDQVCQEVDGVAKCSCYKGFLLNGTRCIDINECDEDDGGCEYKCVNTPGSYRCECPKGMRRGEDKYSCMDINECLLNNGHGPCQDTCRNLERGYECSCEGLPDTVLSSDNHTCQDAGPCSVDNAGCSHTCLSTMGRVFCLCPDGFMLEDDWKTCQDVDECAVPDLQSEVCQYGCVNTPGSYRCAEPLELKDQPILPHSIAVSCDLPGFETTSEGSCVDINECSHDNGGCDEVCENTEGSFFCACDGDERVLSADGKSCVDINNVACPILNPAGRGYVVCSKLTTPKPWRGRKRVINRPGTKCRLKCPGGYQLHGEYKLICRADGTWDGPKRGECIRYNSPRLDCPKDVVAELSQGGDRAFVTFDQPSTDLDWSRYVRSRPSWGKRLEANLKPGVHEITFYAKHPVSQKEKSCLLRITVKDGEAPVIKYCPDDLLVTSDKSNGTIVTWTEPIFTDNVKVTRISSNVSSGHTFDVGRHAIEYEARDEAGWTTKCVFTVDVLLE